jgi:TonB family protein
METVVQPPSDAELHILTDWGDATDKPRKRRAAVLSVVAHVVVVVTLFSLPKDLFETPPRTAEVRITPLIEPLTELTQNAPTKGKINKEFDATELNPRPRIQIPMALPSVAMPQAPQPAEPPKPAPSLPEPPKVEAVVKEMPKPELPQPPPPQIQPVETPKLAFEAPSLPPPPLPPGQRVVPLPDTSVSGAIRQAARSASAGGLVVGDFGASGPGINLPPSPGSQGSNMQLLTDPQGVDFRPYLTRILASVKQHWLSVMPESVRLGRRGKVAIQFSISRDGQVPKLVIAEFSGADALDRAAVAGISASVPFPPLPSEFKGDRIVLQMNFAYNMPRQ